MTTLFGKVIRREIPADIVYEDELCLAFRDINPQAPTHVLLIPKKEIDKLSSADGSDQALLGHMMLAAAKVARQLGVEDAFRLVVNNGAEAGQSVFHLHLHILAGRMIVYLNIDEVIALIRGSDNPKEDLMAHFELSERQAEDILEIRLRQLARLEGIKIEKEIKALKAEAKELKHVLGSEDALRELVVSEIEADAKTYGDERRTLIEEAQVTKVTAQVSDEPVTVFISQRFWVRMRQGHGIDATSIAFKDGDSIAATYECRTTDQCIVICSNGRVCSIPVSSLPSGRGDGAPLATFIELAPGARIAHAFCGKTETPVLISTSAGYGFPCFIGDMVGRNKAGKQFISVKEDTILPPVILAPTQNSLVAVLSKHARMLVFVLSELKLLQGGGKGMMLIDLKEGDELTACTVVNSPAVTLSGTAGSKVQQLHIGGKELQTYFGARARAGKAVETKMKGLRFE